MDLTQPGVDVKLNFSTEKRSFLGAAPLEGGQTWILSPSQIRGNSLINTRWAKLKRLCSCLKKKKKKCLISPNTFNLGIYWHFDLTLFTILKDG